jgi:acetyltransferase-like isoleucine patch superfamily enzyme
MLTDPTSVRVNMHNIEGTAQPVSVSFTDILDGKKIRYAFQILSKISRLCKQADANFLKVVYNFFKTKILYGKNILMHERVIIKKIQNIKSNTVLQIGLGNAQFVHKYDITYLNINGTLFFKGNHTIGRGCRFDIAENATVLIGKNGYINAKSTFIISHKLVIGDDCVISWNCQFLDNDYHQITYNGKIERPNEIIIGNHVWVGSDVKIYKGTTIPDGCVIAAGSIVRGVFTEKNSLIGGNPARIIRQNLLWE